MRRRKATAVRGGSSQDGRRDDLLGRRIGTEAKPHKPTLQAVADGQVCIGHLMSRGREGVEAFDAENRSLGTFPDMASAANAVSAAAQKAGRS